MFGLDPTALFIGFAAGVVLWGGRSFIIGWAHGIITRRNTPDYEAEVQRLNGRVFELESALNTTVTSAEAELSERAQDAADVQALRERTQELEQQLAAGAEAGAALSAMTPRAEDAERTLESLQTELRGFLVDIRDRVSRNFARERAASNGADSGDDPLRPAELHSDTSAPEPAPEHH
jgi:chromosome segregation ATPase